MDGNATRALSTVSDTENAHNNSARSTSLRTEGGFAYVVSEKGVPVSVTCESLINDTHGSPSGDGDVRISLSSRFSASPHVDVYCSSSLIAFYARFGFRVIRNSGERAYLRKTLTS